MTEHKKLRSARNKMHLLSGTEGKKEWRELHEMTFVDDRRMYTAAMKRVKGFYKHGWFVMKHFVTYNTNLTREDQQTLLSWAEKEYPRLFELKPRPYFSRGFFHDLCAALLQGEIDEETFDCAVSKVL